MTTSTNPPPPLPGCTVLPPMESPRDRHADQDQGRASKAKGKPAHRKTADRFAVLNAFVDAGMVGLAKVEALTWLVLYRDTRNGTACTSEEHIAARIGCSKRAVAKAVGRLRRRGLLTQVFKGGINRGPSRYRVMPTPKPPGH
jgi:biotin operon repressor